MRRRRTRGGAAAWATMLILCSFTTASADIAIESHLGERPSDPAPTHALAAMREILHDKGGVAVDPEAVRASLRHPGRPAIADPSLTAEALLSQFQLGFRAWLHGQVQQAATQFEATLRIADQNMGLVVQDPKLRAAKARALAGLAVSRNRLKDTRGATDAMLELLRTSPGEHVGDNYGPEGDKLAAETLKQLAGVAPGKLTVNVSADEAKMFLDDAPIDSSGAPASFSKDLPPGEHHLVVQVSTLLLRYDVSIKPSETTTLSIDWRIDAALNSTRSWVGFDALGSRSNELFLLQDLGKLVEPGAAIYTIGASPLNRGSYTVTGARYDVSEKRTVRSGQVRMDATTDHDEKLQDLARFLLYDQSSATVVPVTEGVQSTAEVIVHPPLQLTQRETRWPTWLAGGLGIAALAAAPVLIYLDQRGTCGFHTAADCRFVYGTGTLGWVSLGAGVVSSAFSIYWYFHTRHAAPVDVSVVPASLGAIASFGWAF